MRLRGRWTVGLVALAVAGCGLPGSGGSASTPGPPRQGAQAPDFRLTGLDGKPHGLSDYRGHVVLINFWATWCIPCRAEMGELETTYKTHQARGAVFLGVDYQEPRDTAQAFIDERQVTYPILLDADGRVYKSYDSTPSPPETFVLDRSGRVLAHYIGIRTRDWFDQRLRDAGA